MNPSMELLENVLFSIVLYQNPLDSGIKFNRYIVFTPESGVGLSVFDLLYGFVLFAFSPFLAVKLLIDRSFRKDFFTRLSPNPIPDAESQGESPSRIWVHAASIGEIRLAIKLIHSWMEKEPGKSFFITTNTIQSRDLARKETEVPVQVAPLDLSPVVKRFIQKSHPNHLILIETEIWPNMVRMMSEIGVVSIVNGRLSDRYFRRYLFFKRSLTSTMHRIERVLARDGVSAARFQKLGVPAARVINQGNLKYEIPKTPDPDEIEQVKASFSALKGDFLFVAGSLQPDELPYILPAWKTLTAAIEGFRLVIIPRHPDKKDEFAGILAQHNISHSFASESVVASQTSNNTENHIFVVDKMGVLKTWYYIADAVFVGGSLCDRGGQNMVEAVGYCKPVCTGPYATNFQDEVRLLTEANGLKIISNANDLEDFVTFCASHPQEAAAMGKRGYLEIEKQSHALEDNVLKLTEIYSNR